MKFDQNQRDAILQSIRTRASIPAAFFHIEKLAQGSSLLGQFENTEGSRSLREESYTSFGNKARKLSQFLLSQGVRRAESIAILSQTRYEWLLSDLAILLCGGISVSIYQSVHRDEVGYILFDSGAKIVFAENSEQVEKLLSIHEGTCQIPETEDRDASTETIRLKYIITFEKVPPHPLVKHMDDIIYDSSLSSECPEACSLIKPEHVASIVYTSGTTGPPKGVIQTHYNHLINVWQAGKSGIFATDKDLFLFLPLAHSFAKLIGYVGLLTTAQLKLPTVASSQNSQMNPALMMQDMKVAGALCVPCVPRILEKLQSGLLHKAAGKSLGASLLKLSIWSATTRFKRLRNGEEPNLFANIADFLTGFLRKKIKSQIFGDGFAHVVSGGAKLPLEVNEFFNALGMTIYQGYGLTETCVATNVNRIGLNKLETVGPVLDEVELRISTEGEILFRGPNMAEGYLNRPTATSATWDKDGWLHTGDLGSVDADGYLSITGRIKDILVTSGGKKIAPTTIEELLTSHPLIAQAVLFGDAKPYCVALLTLDKMEASNYASPSLVADAVNIHVGKVNSTLSRFETVKKFSIVDDEFTVENGLLTPTFKIKRKVVYAKFKENIEALYS